MARPNDRNENETECSAREKPGKALVVLLDPVANLVAAAYIARGKPATRSAGRGTVVLMNEDEVGLGEELVGAAFQEFLFDLISRWIAMCQPYREYAVAHA